MIKQFLTPALLFVYIFSFAQSDVAKSNRIASLVKIDGDASEWHLPLRFYDSNTKLFFDFSNDDNFRESVHFLPAFDEILISYKTREASILLEHQSKAFTNNGIFKPIILENGKVIGIWKRTIKKDHAKIETQFFNVTENHKKAILFEGIKSFEKYLETKIIIE